MKTIKLTRGKVAIVDDEDYKELNKHKWHAVETYSAFYAKRKGEKGTAFFGKIFSMHRCIMNFPSGDIDHINRNGLDNRRYNLRICTHSQNHANKKLPITNKSGLRGVYWSTSNNKWRASIEKEGYKISLGSFVSKEEAGRAYDKKAKELYGDFARLNFE